MSEVDAEFGAVSAKGRALAYIYSKPRNGLFQTLEHPLVHVQYSIEDDTRNVESSELSAIKDLQFIAVDKIAQRKYNTPAQYWKAILADTERCRERLEVVHRSIDRQ